MFDTETVVLLRAVLNEVCKCVSGYDFGTRFDVASKILEAARRGETSAEALKRVAHDALSGALPTLTLVVTKTPALPWR
jgi:hypothetical protein